MTSLDFFLKNCDSASSNQIENLIRGTPYTTNEDYMWTCNLPDPPTTPELYINIKSETLGGLRIWNYNRSLLESTKGIKEIEII